MSDEHPYSADDEAQVKKRQTKAKRAAERELDDWRWLLGDARGRRIVWKLLEDAGLFRSSFAAESATTAFNEGQRNAGLRVLTNVMTADPDAFVTMQREAKEF